MKLSVSPEQLTNCQKLIVKVFGGSNVKDQEIKLHYIKFLIEERFHQSFLVQKLHREMTALVGMNILQEDEDDNMLVYKLTDAGEMLRKSLMSGNTHAGTPNILQKDTDSYVIHGTRADHSRPAVFVL